MLVAKGPVELFGLSRFVTDTKTHGHTQWEIRGPVRSAMYKQLMTFEFIPPTFLDKGRCN